jgi:hypothetical protein
MQANVSLWPWSWNLYFLAVFIYLLGLSTKPHRFLPRWLFFIAFACIAVYLVCFTSTNNPTNNFALGSHVVTLLFGALDYLILRNAQKDVAIEGKRPGAIEDEPLWERLKWGFKLIRSQRGIGWIDPCAPKVHHLPPSPHPDTTRKAFILSKLGDIAFNILLFDLAGFVNRLNPHFKQHGPPLSGAENAFVWRLAMVFGFAAAEHALVVSLHCFYSIVSVGLGETEPRDWPPMFGSLSDAYTLRKFWK